jgi:hypothetical protein
MIIHKWISSDGSELVPTTDVKINHTLSYLSQAQTAKYNWATSCSHPLITAATVKLHCIIRRAREIGVLSPKMMCRLFDTLIRPSLTYGSEVWGVELGPLDHDKSGTVANSVEKMHLQHLKRIIGVKKSTASSHVRGNLGDTLR